ncbi:MAG: hypothetical protein WBF13_01895 [Candidatus Zixiibacteriota bacterium]
MKTNDIAEVWLPVIGRALGYMVAQSPDLRDKKLVHKAQVLKRLGLPRKEIAALLGTSADSVGGLLRYAGKPKSKKAKRKKSLKEE